MCNNFQKTALTCFCHGFHAMMLALRERIFGHLTESQKEPAACLGELPYTDILFFSFSWDWVPFETECLMRLNWASLFFSHSLISVSCKNKFFSFQGFFPASMANWIIWIAGFLIQQAVHTNLWFAKETQGWVDKKAQIYCLGTSKFPNLMQVTGLRPSGDWVYIFDSYGVDVGSAPGREIGSPLSSSNVESVMH